MNVAKPTYGTASDTADAEMPLTGRSAAHADELDRIASRLDDVLGRVLGLPRPETVPAIKPAYTGLPGSMAAAESNANRIAQMIHTLDERF